jgi:hypothetical protein
MALHNFFGLCFNAIKFIDTKTDKDGMIMLYSEGANYTGNQHLDPLYWIIGTHEQARLKYINLV